MYFRNYVLRKTWLDKCLKSPVSDNLLTENFVKVPKQRFNRNNSTFARFFDHCEGN